MTTSWPPFSGIGPVIRAVLLFAQLQANVSQQVAWQMRFSTPARRPTALNFEHACQAENSGPDRK
jgi:hypothetical protein